MASMEDLRKMRTGQANNTQGMIGRGSMFPPQFNGGGYYPKGLQQNVYYPHNSTMLASTSANGELDDLTRGLRGLNLQAPSFSSSNKASPQMPFQSAATATMPMNAGGGPTYLYNGHVMWAGNPYVAHGAGQNASGGSPTANVYNPIGTQYVPAGVYGGQPQYTDSSPSWTNSRVTSSEIPTLITPRRDSSSSNENDAPGTPFTQYTGYGDFRPGVAVVDHSPQGAYSWGTPSPLGRFGPAKPPAEPTTPLHIQLLCAEDPPVPRAVPAPFSPSKPLDRALENPNGVTNVYVRGLQPDTTDEMLYKLARRFGEIVSSKSIIDHNTGKCKG